MVYLPRCARFGMITRREQRGIAVTAATTRKGLEEVAKRCFSLARPAVPGYNVANVHAP
jgi:hypothetical protein